MFPKGLTVMKIKSNRNDRFFTLTIQWMIHDNTVVAMYVYVPGYSSDKNLLIHSIKFYSKWWILLYVITLAICCNYINAFICYAFHWIPDFSSTPITIIIITLYYLHLAFCGFESDESVNHVKIRLSELLPEYCSS